MSKGEGGQDPLNLADTICEQCRKTKEERIFALLKDAFDMNDKNCEITTISYTISATGLVPSSLSKWS